MSNNTFTVEVFYIALIKDGQIRWLVNQPYYSEEAAMAAIAKLEPVGGSCHYEVVAEEEYVSVNRKE